MKKKIFTMLFAVSLISFGASAQTIQENIDKAAKDKSNADRAAKADVLIQKKTISNSTTSTTTTSTDKPAKINTLPDQKYKIKKKKHHKKLKRK